MGYGAEGGGAQSARQEKLRPRHRGHDRRRSFLRRRDGAAGTHRLGEESTVSGLSSRIAQGANSLRLSANEVLRSPRRKAGLLLPLHIEIRSTSSSARMGSGVRTAGFRPSAAAPRQKPPILLRPWAKAKSASRR